MQRPPCLRISASASAVGGRYSYEKKKASIVSSPNTATTLAGATLPFSDEDSWNQFTPKATLQYDFDAAMVYLTYARGFKSGGFNYPAGGGTPLNPEILDMIELGPLWARWRKVDTYDGLLRGQVSISGDLNNLAFDFRCEVKDYSYYHYTAMQLDPEHSFKLPEGELAGRIELKDGETWTFKDVSLDAPEATLATGEHMNANGGGKLTLNGVVPELTGKLVATVTDGRIARRISWSPTATQSLNDVEPNIVIVAEQFGKIDLDWEVDVQKLEVDCEPVTGTLSGKLTGTFSKEAGKRVGALRAEGELKLADGRVKCLGIDGELMGSLKFRQTAPTYHAALEGRLTASLGETPIDCEVTGDVKHPVFIFSGAGMSPQDLSRKIFRYSATELTPADQVKRREECTRIFGPAAAVEENPFLAKNAGHVTFNVK